METVEIEIGSGVVEAELADSFFRQFWGLSLRNEGKMLFDFKGETRALIDMALLSDSLYLYFIDSDKEVLEVQKAEPWGFDPRSWKLYRPNEPYSYLLESFDKLEIDQGDRLEF